MGKRTFSIVLALALVAGVFSVLPARAQEVPAVPAEPNVTDPTGDANYLNDQGLNAITGREGDHNEAPADASTSADLMAGWFTNDAQSVTAHILVEGALPSTPSYFYRVHVDPAGGEDDCLWFQAGIPGVADVGPSPDPIGNLRNVCGDGTVVDGEVSLAANPDGGTIVSIKVPMGTHGLAIGMTLGSPNVSVRNWPRSPDGPIATAPQVDNTKLGLPYEITAGGPVAKPEEEEPPGKSDPPGKGKKKGCKKGKGKKKGACPGKKPGKPKPPVQSCAAYEPGEMGAEAETSMVTDEATEEAPIEVEVPLGPAGGAALAYDTTTRMKHNVQIDSKAGEVGFWARLESPITDDPDLFVYWPDGSQAAVAGGFNLTPVGPLDGTGSGGHSEMGAEQIDGLRTSDCQGWTLDLVNWLGVGGTYNLKLWLGEVENDPAAPGAEQAALSTFYGLLGI